MTRPRPLADGPTVPSWLDELARNAGDAEPGHIAHLLPPDDGSGRESAVLILFGDSPAGPSVVLLERASTLRQHAGQIAFPGGGCDPEDADVVATALREAAEEIDLDPSTVEVFGELPKLFLSVTGFVVSPVLAYWRDPHPVVALDDGEVAQVVVVAISDLVAPANRFTVEHSVRMGSPGFQVGGLFIWGFTAMVLDAVLRMGGWERSWDSSVTRAIPASVNTRASAGTSTVEL